MQAPIQAQQAPIQAQQDHHPPEASNPRGQIPTTGGKEMETQMQAYNFAEHQNTDTTH